MEHSNKKNIRNISVYYIGTLLLAIAGGFVMASGEEVGGLLFVLSPLTMVLIVRFILGSGWKNAGLRLNIKRNWGWYLFALLFYPVIFILAILINTFFGFSSLSGSFLDLLPLILAGFAAQLLPRMFFALSEEWGWRGFLEPMFAQLGIPDLKRHLWVGLLWGIWHFPLILSTEYTRVPLIVYLPLFMIGVLFLAVINGQMQKASGSVWPAVISHGIGNALGFALLNMEQISFSNELFGYITPGSIVITMIYGATAFLVFHRNRTVNPQAGPTE